MGLSDSLRDDLADFRARSRVRQLRDIADACLFVGIVITLYYMGYLLGAGTPHVSPIPRIAQPYPKQIQLYLTIMWVLPWLVFVSLFAAAGAFVLSVGERGEADGE